MLVLTIQGKPTHLFFNQVFFWPKPKTWCTALSQHKTENWTWSSFDIQYLSIAEAQCPYLLASFSIYLVIGLISARLLTHPLNSWMVHRRKFLMLSHKCQFLGKSVRKCWNNPWKEERRCHETDYCKSLGHTVVSCTLFTQELYCQSYCASRSSIGLHHSNYLWWEQWYYYYNWCKWWPVIQI